jgi:hypothetical protein
VQSISGHGYQLRVLKSADIDGTDLVEVRAELATPGRNGEQIDAAAFDDVLELLLPDERRRGEATRADDPTVQRNARYTATTSNPVPFRTQRVGNLPHRVGHGPSGLPTEQRTRGTVGEQQLSQRHASRAHRIPALDPICQPEDRLAAGPHRDPLDHDRRDHEARPDAVDVLDQPAKVASDLLPSAGVDQLAGTQRERRAAPQRVPGRDTPVERSAGEVHAQPNWPGSA